MWSCEFGPGSSPDLLKALAGKQIKGLEIKDLRPDADTSFLRGGSAMVVVLVRPRITAAQMKDIVGFSANITVIGDFKWDSLPEPPLKLAVPTLSFSSPPGMIGTFFKGIDDTCPPSVLIANSVIDLSLIHI